MEKENDYKLMSQRKVEAKMDASKNGNWAGNNRKQFSSAILFVSVIILVNLCPPFHSDLDQYQPETVRLETNVAKYTVTTSNRNPSGMNSMPISYYLANLDTCLKFVKLMFTNPVSLSKRSIRFIVADAKVLGKMAKVWYIKKKIKKLSKKLKKHTIAVPVFTAIPIYEHSYYPQPHVTHVTHGGMHHAAAASSYSPALAQVTASGTAASNHVGQTQQMATSASNNHHQMAAYRLPPPAGNHHHPSMYHPMPAASAHQIINSYAPSPPLYVDEAGGLYGHYGNAYGRYDGGYQLW